jgi:hypothetical protein
MAGLSWQHPPLSNMVAIEGVSATASPAVLWKVLLEITMDKGLSACASNQRTKGSVVAQHCRFPPRNLIVASYRSCILHALLALCDQSSGLQNGVLADGLPPGINIQVVGKVHLFNADLFHLLICPPSVDMVCALHWTYKLPSPRGYTSFLPLTVDAT